jgi:hypothetical protein
VKTNSRNRRINATLPELVATISEFAFEYSMDTREAYDLARAILVELLQEASHGSQIIDRDEPKTSAAALSPPQYATSNV